LWQKLFVTLPRFHAEKDELLAQFVLSEKPTMFLRPGADAAFCGRPASVGAGRLSCEREPSFAQA
jgi:hypothetical protein